MLVADRHQKIVELVHAEGSARVAELSQMFQVTEETIRRDLDKLEAEGKILRTHGGAVASAEYTREIPFSQREVARIEEKKRIAARAVQLVEAGDRIALDASTTAWQMAKILPDIRLTVVTNSVKVIVELAGKENIQVMSIGGVLVPRSLSFVGPLAERNLESYHVNKAFISCSGLHIQYGITESTEEQAQIKQKMIANAEQTILLMDATKFGVRAFTKAADIHEVSTIITDTSISHESAELLQSVPVTVYLA